MTRYEYGNKKICYRDDYELQKQLNNLHCTRILHIVPGTPDFTTTQHCRIIYYETEIKEK